VVTVPSVIGMRASRATETLQAAGLKVVTQDSPAGGHGKGNRVVNQMPSAGQQVPRDSSVVIFVGASHSDDENG
jgi:beta-lactam-binding protein with PASTA domain